VKVDPTISLSRIWCASLPVGDFEAVKHFVDPRVEPTVDPIEKMLEDIMDFGVLERIK
jgi:hypothetical protein